jgi:Mrp family chromosome partitioning ATPase
VVTVPGQVIRPAGLPTAPNGPGLVVVLVAAAFLGGAAGVVLAFVRDRTDPRISTRRAMTAITGLEPLAIVPGFPTNDATPALSDPEGRAAGALRRLRVSVWPQRGDGPRRLVVTSPTSASAADQVAGNLALTLALAGWSTLLAWTTSSDDAAGADHVGLAPYGAAADGRPVRGALGVDGLSLLALPVTPGRSGTAAERLAERLDSTGSAYDVEIIVAPALLRAADAFEASPLSDAMLVVVDVADERREDLAASVDALEAIGAPLEGIVAYAVPKGW